MIEKLPTDIKHWDSPLEPMMFAKINEIIAWANQVDVDLERIRVRKETSPPEENGW